MLFDDMANKILLERPWRSCQKSHQPCPKPHGTGYGNFGKCPHRLLPTRKKRLHDFGRYNCIAFMKTAFLVDFLALQCLKTVIKQNNT